MRFFQQIRSSPAAKRFGEILLANLGLRTSVNPPQTHLTAGPVNKDFECSKRNARASNQFCTCSTFKHPALT